jgi:hypothetical protein
MRECFKALNKKKRQSDIKSNRTEKQDVSFDEEGMSKMKENKRTIIKT